MSKSKCIWWGYVKSIIRQYPALVKEHDTPLEPCISPSMGGIGHDTSDTLTKVERCVIHDLSEAKQRKYDAINAVIKEVKQRHPQDSRERLEVIDLVYWKRTHTLAGAALNVNASERTVIRWQGEFISLLAEELELP